MSRVLQPLRSLRDSRHGSAPVQYAIVAAGTALIAVMVAQTAASKFADKFNAVTAALVRIQF